MNAKLTVISGIIIRTMRYKTIVIPADAYSAATTPRITMSIRGKATPTVT